MEFRALNVVASTLRAELVPEPVEHWCQVLLGKFFVLLPCGYDCRLEFLFVEFRWVGVVGLDWLNNYACVFLGLY